MKKAHICLVRCFGIISNNNFENLRFFYSLLYPPTVKKLNNETADDVLTSHAYIDTGVQLSAVSQEIQPKRGINTWLNGFNKTVSNLD